MVHENPVHVHVLIDVRARLAGPSQNLARGPCTVMANTCKFSYRQNYHELQNKMHVHVGVCARGSKLHVHLVALRSARREL